MSKDKTFGEVLNDFIKEPKRHFNLHVVYTDGTDDFDRYDEMNECDIVCATAAEVLHKLIAYVERDGFEHYVITDIPRGIKYKNVSSFIADYINKGNKASFWNMFMRRGIDTEGCKAHLYDEVPEDKGSDRPTELPRDSETPDSFEYESNAIISFTLDVGKTDLRYLKDCAIILVDAINRIDTCNQETGSIKHDLSLMNRLLKFVNTAIEYKEKSQKEDEDYQLYLKLKERFEGGK